MRAIVSGWGDKSAMNDPTSPDPDRARGLTIVIVADDPAQLTAELESLVGHLQNLAWSNGPPNIQVVAATPRSASGPPFIERRKRSTDRRHETCLLVPDADTASNADPGPRPQILPGSLVTDRRQPCTDREREIVDLLRHGMTNKQIAQQLGIMEETVKKHLQHIYDKLGVRRRALVMLGRVGTRMYIDGNSACS
jgi:DNA-binding CsgD family transcriptional regulator